MRNLYRRASAFRNSAVFSGWNTRTAESETLGRCPASNEFGMNDFVQLSADQYRLLVTVRYLNASEAICRGLQSQRGINDFYFLVTLRSFIEYTRRGVWFLAWASDQQLRKAEKLTFRQAGSHNLAGMDAMINEALGEGRVSHLMDKLPGINEPFLHCLHALTHGNPISVRMTTLGLDKIFNTAGLLKRAEMELDIFRIPLYRRMLGEDLRAIWKALSAIRNRPDEVHANVLIAAHKLKESDKSAQALGYKLP